MGGSQRPFHQRLGQFSRRRRMLLGRQGASEIQQQPDTDEPATSSNPSPAEQPLSAEVSAVDSLRDVASRWLAGRETTGSAVLADFPEVECELIPTHPPSPQASQGDDPTSVFSDWGAARSDSPRQGDAASHSALPASAVTGRLPIYAPQGNSAGIQLIREWLQQPEPRVWMFLGDDTTAWMRYRGAPGYVEMFRHRLRWELRRTADLVVNAGLQRAGLRELKQVARQGLQQCRADTVFVMPGRSDVAAVAAQPTRYAEQLRQLALQVHASGADLVLQTPPWRLLAADDRWAHPAALMIDLIREISVVLGIPLIDHAGFWQEQAGPFAWFDYTEHLPTAAGQAVLGLQFLSELGAYSADSTLCQRLHREGAAAEKNASDSPAPPPGAVSGRPASDIIR